MTITRRKEKLEEADDRAESEEVTDQQVEEFLRGVLDLQRRFFYETDRKLLADRRTEARRLARVVLGVEKRGSK